MNTNDKPQRPDLPTESDASDAFKVALAALGLERKDLATAIDSHDYETVQLAAAEVVRVWISASQRCESVVARAGRHSPIANSARAVLRDHLVAVQQLFIRAKQEIGVPALTRKLDTLWSTLATANNQRVTRDANAGNR